jgi:Winged helix-turn helix
VKDAGRRGPREAGSPSRWWTTKLVRHFIDTRWGLASCRERVRQLRHDREFRLRRLRPRHLKAKPEEQEAFRAALAALVEGWPAEWALLGVGEVTVRRHPPLTAQWCLVADVPEVPTGDDQTQVPVDGAVAPLTGRPHDHISPTVRKDAFATFLPPRLAS